MHLEPVGANGTKLWMVSCFIRVKVDVYFSIQDFDLHDGEGVFVLQLHSGGTTLSLA